MNEFEKQFFGGDAIKATEHSILATDLSFLKGLTPNLSDLATDRALRHFEEEEARRKKLIGLAMPRTIAEYHALHGTPFRDAFSTSEAFRLQQEIDLRRQLVGGVMADEAAKLALSSQEYCLNDHLEQFRTAVGPLTDKMLYLDSLDSIRSTERLNAFVNASAMSDIFQSTSGYDRHLRDALTSFSASAVPRFDTLKEYGSMLSAAGMSLPHWPHVRLLTIGEKRRKLRQKLNENAEPKHVRTARSVIQRYEVTLRQIIDEVMSNEYGDDWAHKRLRECNCNDLYGKWTKRGGDVFKHADYAHYLQIMCDPEHFQSVFSGGFDDPDALEALIKRAGELRVSVMHFHDFSQEDLRDLRITWRAIESGLLGLTDSYELVYH